MCSRAPNAAGLRMGLGGCKPRPSPYGACPFAPERARDTRKACPYHPPMPCPIMHNFTTKGKGPWLGPLPYPAGARQCSAVNVWCCGWPAPMIGSCCPVALKPA